jgi:hypothetical protein
MLSKSNIRALTILAAAVVLGGYLYHVSAHWVQINDDAFITLRYSRMLAEGHGPYFNPAEHVEGYLNFLFMLQMALAIALFGADDAPFVAKLLNVDGGLAAILGAWLLCARWLLQIEGVRSVAYLLAWLAGGLVALNAAFAVNSTTGLETTQFSALILIGLCVLQFETEQRRWWGSAILFALATLSRPEGVLIFALVWAARWAVGERRDAGSRRLLVDAAVVVGALAAHLCFRWVAYGEWLPNVFYAKLGGFVGAGTEIDYIRRFVVMYLGVPVALLALVPAFLTPASLRRFVMPSLFALVSGLILVLANGPDRMLGSRLMAPFVPVWAALAGLGLALIADRVVRARVATAVVASVALIGWCWYSQQPIRRELAAIVRTKAIGYVRGHLALADWLRANAKDGETVALMDIGLVGFNCPNLRILDITGLTNAEIAHAPGGFLSKVVNPHVILDRKPEYIVVVNQALREWQGLSPDGQVQTRFDRSKLRRFTPIEQALVDDPHFAENYYQTHEPRPDEPLDEFAAMFGADRVFLHDLPDVFYLLTLYRYHDQRPQTAPPTQTQPAPASQDSGPREPVQRRPSAGEMQPRPMAGWLRIRPLAVAPRPGRLAWDCRGSTIWEMGLGLPA